MEKSADLYHGDHITSPVTSPESSVPSIFFLCGGPDWWPAAAEDDDDQVFSGRSPGNDITVRSPGSSVTSPTESSFTYGTQLKSPRLQPIIETRENGNRLLATSSKIEVQEEDDDDEHDYPVTPQSRSRSLSTPQPIQYAPFEVFDGDEPTLLQRPPESPYTLSPNSSSKSTRQDQQWSPTKRLNRSMRTQESPLGPKSSSSKLSPRSPHRKRRPSPIKYSTQSPSSAKKQSRSSPRNKERSIDSNTFTISGAKPFDEMSPPACTQFWCLDRKVLCHNSFLPMAWSQLQLFFVYSS